MHRLVFLVALVAIYFVNSAAPAVQFIVQEAPNTASELEQRAQNWYLTRLNKERGPGKHFADFRAYREDVLARDLVRITQLYTADQEFEIALRAALEKATPEQKRKALAVLLGEALATELPPGATILPALTP